MQKTSAFVTVVVATLICLSPWCNALANDDDDARTGYYRVSYTPLELLGEQGAAAIKTLFPPDEPMSWQLSVSPDYDPALPAGVMVYVNAWPGAGGSKALSHVLGNNNIIWIGLINAGDKKPLNERILRAVLAQAVVEREYQVDHSRYYVAGFLGGAHVAAMLATTRPEVFKGAVYIGDALYWNENKPEKMAAIQKNRFAFMVGSKDKRKRHMQRMADNYREDGVVYSELFIEANAVKGLPGSGIFQSALDFLQHSPK